MTKNNTDVWPTLEQLSVEYEQKEELEEYKDNLIDESFTPEESHMPSFFESEESTEYADDNEKATPDIELNDAELSESEEKTIRQSSYANLTRLFQYQINDINRELKNTQDEIKEATGSKRVDLKKKAAELYSRKEELVGKIKKSKELNNLEEIVDFGKQAVSEVNKLLSDPSITEGTLRYIERISKFWSLAGDFSKEGNGHIIFGDSLDANKKIKLSLAEIKSDIDEKSKTIFDLRKDLVMRNVRKQLGGEYSENDIFKAIQDIGFIKANMFSLADYDAPLLSAIYKAMGEAD